MSGNTKLLLRFVNGFRERLEAELEDGEALSHVRFPLLELDPEGRAERQDLRFDRALDYRFVTRFKAGKPISQQKGPVLADQDGRYWAFLGFCVLLDVRRRMHPGGLVTGGDVAGSIQDESAVAVLAGIWPAVAAQLTRVVRLQQAPPVSKNVPPPPPPTPATSGVAMGVSYVDVEPARGAQREDRQAYDLADWLVSLLVQEKEGVLRQVWRGDGGRPDQPFDPLDLDELRTLFLTLALVAVNFHEVGRFRDFAVAQKSGEGSDAMATAFATAFATLADVASRYRPPDVRHHRRTVRVLRYAEVLAGSLTVAPPLRASPASVRRAWLMDAMLEALVRFEEQRPGG